MFLPSVPLRRHRTTAVSAAQRRSGRAEIPLVILKNNAVFAGVLSAGARVLGRRHYAGRVPFTAGGFGQGAAGRGDRPVRPDREGYGRSPQRLLPGAELLLPHRMAGTRSGADDRTPAGRSAARSIVPAAP